ncbi:MAG: energy-coupling factor ABC transporter ATP-binding protein [Candidatus Nezhaarchaeota archaeon]|nr:energy-coupling factor ABC transporter ATP-binding protein [Candidatus Nezhaarchaeota archaeon]
MSAIVVEDLWYSYPNHPEPVLKGVDLKIDKGELVAIVGENGAGKTTLAKHFIGLLKPQRGRVEVLGLDTSKAEVYELAKYVGFAFQNPDHQLFSETVEKEVGFVLKNLGVPLSEATRRVEATLAKLGIAEFRARSPLTLSSGERRRVALASILSHDPSLLILDEPTVGQDAAQKERLALLMGRLAKEGKTVVVITHDVEFVADYIDRVIVMSKGKVVADGPAEEVLVNESLLLSASLKPPVSIEVAKALVKRGLLREAKLYRSVSKLVDDVLRGLHH